MKNAFQLILIISMLHFPVALGQEKHEMPADICAFKLDDHISLDSLWRRSFLNSKKIKAGLERALPSADLRKVQNLFLKKFSDMHEFSVIDLQRFLESQQTSKETTLTKDELKKLWNAIQECSKRSNEVCLKYKNCKTRLADLQKEFEHLKGAASTIETSNSTSQIEFQYALRKQQRTLNEVADELVASKKEVEDLTNGN